MIWYSAATCFLGGGLALAGLMAWHIANGDVLGFLAALMACGLVWLSGDMLARGNGRAYSALVISAAIAAVASSVAIGV